MSDMALSLFFILVNVIFLKSVIISSDVSRGGLYFRHGGVPPLICCRCFNVKSKHHYPTLHPIIIHETRENSFTVYIYNQDNGLYQLQSVFMYKQTVVGS